VIPISPATIDRWESLIQEEGHVVSRSPEGEVRIDGVPAPTYRIEKNYFFVLGDNRDDSIDSRQWGYVPDDAIVGRAMLVYWSWDESSPARNAFVSRLLSVRWPRIGTLIR
jgi:signal peptidase I